MARSCLSVGAGSAPLNPPMVTTALPLLMMIGAVVIDPFAATRYFAEPWWASRYRTRLSLTEPPPPATPPPKPPEGEAPHGGGAVGRDPEDAPPGPPKPDGGPPKPPRPPPNPAPALAGPASTLLEVSERPTVATLYAAGPPARASAPQTAATASVARPRTPRRTASTATTASAPATGMTARSAGTKSGVRAGTMTAPHALAPIASARAAKPAHDSRAHRASATTPKPVSAATAGASALT